MEIRLSKRRGSNPKATFPDCKDCQNYEDGGWADIGELPELSSKCACFISPKDSNCFYPDLKKKDDE